MQNNLIRKYNIPAPRYTSYPTVPYWEKEAPDSEQWIGSISDSWYMVNKGKGISLYIHLPYCESLCTYCGCNTRITVNHKVEEPYIRAVLEEWAMYESAFPETAVIDEIHLGGGTPTFFSPENLRQLILGIQGSAIISNNAHLSFEAHPANTTKEHLEVLYELGFRRLSLGIQDFDPHVQEVINRKQSEEQVME
ncbi:MAG TPA: radical SAM protein, partial [Flavobacteriales bacterium]|nr:radical SAM protein [Flavobacteriales bacterium]